MTMTMTDIRRMRAFWEAASGGRNIDAARLLMLNRTLNNDRFQTNYERSGDRSVFLSVITRNDPVDFGLKFNVLADFTDNGVKVSLSAGSREALAGEYQTRFDEQGKAGFGRQWKNWDEAEGELYEDVLEREARVERLVERCLMPALGRAHDVGATKPDPDRNDSVGPAR